MNFAARQLVPGDWVVQRMPGSEQLDEDVHPSPVGTGLAE